MSLPRRKPNPATSALREGRAALDALHGRVQAPAVAAGPSLRNRVPELRRVLAGPRLAGSPIDKAANLVSETYLEGVRALPCAFCSSRAPSTAHHVLPRGRRMERNDLMAVPACGSGSTGCHGLAHNARMPWERQLLAVGETMMALFRQRGKTWWRGVVAELVGGLS